MAHALTLFARAPVPGQTKTRLIPALGADGAAALYHAFLQDIVARFAPHFDLTLSCAGELENALLHQLAEQHDLTLRAQAEGSLGVRMSHSLARMNDDQGRGVIVGTDMPTLPLAFVQQAHMRLDEADVVLGPSSDGGYYLVGSRRNFPQLFDGVRFSSRHALADTQASAARCGARVALLTPWYDIDEPADLSLLRAHLALDPRAASRTAALLFDRPSTAR